MRCRLYGGIIGLSRILLCISGLISFFFGTYFTISIKDGIWSIVSMMIALIGIFLFSLGISPSLLDNEIKVKGRG